MAGAIGIDIGTSAVRAAQVAMTRGAPSLLAFGQIPLPHGAIAEGEVRDPTAVSGAISQLWKRSKFRTKNVVIGVANQRVVVRQVDLPYLEEKDFRASLQYQVADHIPMAVEESQLDFQVIGEYQTDEERMMRVLLVAAGTEMVDSFLRAVSNGGLRPIGVDLTPFAVARAVSAAARGETGIAGAEAIIDVGAGVTNIVVHHNGEPRFVRILLVGGDDATDALSAELGVSVEEAEALKLDLGRGVGSDRARQVLSEQVDELVAEIRGSIDYYLSQDDSEAVSSVVVTGGGSLTPGLVARLEYTLNTQIERALPFTDMDVSKSKLSGEQIAHIEPIAAAAVGLAMGAAAK